MIGMDAILVPKIKIMIAFAKLEKNVIVMVVILVTKLQSLLKTEEECDWAIILVEIMSSPYLWKKQFLL